ncbi:MAG: hypothetical protein WDA06_00230 [Phenylobacterium sp.]
MYLIANSSGNYIEIADLGISLKSQQAVDLHRMKLKKNPDASDALKIAIKKGWIKVLKKDKPNTATTERVIVDNSKNDNSEILDEIRKIKEEFNNQLQELAKAKTQNMDQGTLNQILGAISNMAKTTNIANNTTISRSEQKDNNNNVEDNDIDDNIFEKIHTKVVDKIVKNAKTSSLSYNQETITDSDLQGKIDELDDLL